MKELRSVGWVCAVFLFLFAGPLFMSQNERLSAMSMDLSDYGSLNTMRADTFFDYCEYPNHMGYVENHDWGGGDYRYYINMGDQFDCWNNLNADSAQQAYASLVLQVSPPFVAPDSAVYIEWTLWAEDLMPYPHYCFGESAECQDIWVPGCFPDAFFTYSLFSSSMQKLKDGELLPERSDLLYYDGLCD